MVDPKQVELNLYEGIPHLLLPVVDDPRKASTALRWATNEMERRYKIMAKTGMRNIAGFNAKFEKDGQGAMMRSCSARRRPGGPARPGFIGLICSNTMRQRSSGGRAHADDPGHYRRVRRSHDDGAERRRDQRRAPRAESPRGRHSPRLSPRNALPSTSSPDSSKPICRRGVVLPDSSSKIDSRTISDANRRRAAARPWATCSPHSCRGLAAPARACMARS